MEVSVRAALVVTSVPRRRQHHAPGVAARDVAGRLAGRRIAQIQGLQRAALVETRASRRQQHLAYGAAARNVVSSVAGAWIVNAAQGTRFRLCQRALPQLHHLVTMTFRRISFWTLEQVQADLQMR